MPYHQKLHIILVEDSALFRSVSKKQEDSTGSYLKAKVKGLPVKMSDTGQKRPGAYKLKLILVANGSMGEENPWFVHPSILGITTREYWIHVRNMRDRLYPKIRLKCTKLVGHRLVEPEFKSHI